MKTENYFEIGKDGNIIGREKRNKKETKKNFNYQILNIGYYLIVPLLAGTFLGLLIDSKFHTHHLSVVGGILLGALASFYNLIKVTREQCQ